MHCRPYYITFLAAVLMTLCALCGQVSAGGIKGTMYNLPKNNQLLEISAAETIQIRVRIFDTNVSLELRDENGKALPTAARDGRVNFTGSKFAFTLPASVTTANRQAVTIEFFRKDAPPGEPGLTQTLFAVIIADDKTAFQTLDVSVPLPYEMEELRKRVVICQYEQPCQPYRVRHHCLFRRR